MSPSTALRVLVVDDEAPARRRLERMISDLPGAELVGVAEGGRRALELAAATAPDVALLDIRMPDVDGLEVARRLPPGIAVVFTTAHSDFAVDAFEAEAVDYLLKPVRRARLEAALRRVRERRAPGAGEATLDGLGAERLARLMERLAARLDGVPSLPSTAGAPGAEGPTPVVARRGGSSYYFDPRAIDRFTAVAKYVELTWRGEAFTTEESLLALAHRLEPWGFFRVHRSELVRLAAVRAVHTGPRGAAVELDDGRRVAVGRRRLAGLRQALSGLG